MCLENRITSQLGQVWTFCRRLHAWSCYVSALLYSSAPLPTALADTLPDVSQQHGQICQANMHLPLRPLCYASMCLF